jgi:uncharacterized membrane protein
MGNVTLVAATRSDVVVTIHILAVVATFGGALAYPLWFRMIRDGTPEQRAFFHRAQAKLGKVLIMPGTVVIFATGAYLASDFDLWGEAWVLIPTAILAVILLVGAAFLGPNEERLSQTAEAGPKRDYDLVLRRVKLVTYLFAGLVVAATFMMVARSPGGGGGDSTSLVQQAGCLSCHRIGSAGNAGPGGDLSGVGAHLRPPEIRSLLVDPPSGMPSYANLPPAKLDALVSYLSGLTD